MRQLTGAQGTHAKGSDKFVNIHFTNFPDGWNAESLWNIFKMYGDIVEVYIPAKRNVREQRFGFAYFSTPTDVEGLMGSLNNIWIGSYKLRFCLAKRCAAINPSQNGFNPLMPSKNLSPVESSRTNTCAEVVKDDQKAKENTPACLESESASDSIGKEKGPKILNIAGGNFTSEHVQVTLENGILSFKFNIGELLKVLDSDSSSVSTSSVSRKLFSDAPKIDKLDVVEGNKMSQNVHLDQSPSMVREVDLNPNKSLEAMPTGIDLGSCHNKVSGSDGNLGSPCFSVHQLNEVDSSVGGDDVTSHYENEENVSKDRDCIPLTQDEFVVSDLKELVGADDLPSSRAIDVIGKEVNVRATEEGTTGILFLDESEHGVGEYSEYGYIEEMRTPKKKIKRRNHKWSRKKTQSKVKAILHTSVAGKNDLSILDGDIRNKNSLYDEASKTFEVSKLLGFRWENDEMTIQEMLKIVKEAR